MHYSYDQAKAELADIIERIAGISVDIWDAANEKKPLTGEPFYLSATDMVYVFFETEKHFSIKFEPEMIQSPEFSTLAGIVEAIVVCKSD